MNKRSQRKHFAEMLLSLKLHGKKDPLHTGDDGFFSDDIAETNAILHDPKRPKEKKRAAFNRWLSESQPCMFGKTAATNNRVFTCLIDESEILSMNNGDEDLRDTIVDHQKVWRRHALHGLSSSFVILLCSQSIAEVEPSSELKELCRRLMELYLNCDVEDNQILQHEEWAYLAKGKGKSQTLLRFATLPNIFCAQGDRRWWHDHRTPGAIMITSNALGHFMQAQSIDTSKALRMAMGTIQNAHNVPDVGRATSLIKRPPSEATTITADKLKDFSTKSYSGKFHTDHLIPAEFFKDKLPKTQFNDLDFSYIHDPNSSEHAELIAGQPVDWHTVEESIWLGPNEKGDSLRMNMEFDSTTRGVAKAWLTKRLKQRCI